MKNSANKIEKINDKIFKHVFRKKENVKTLLKKMLPGEIKERIDFSAIEVKDTDYVNNQFEEYYSDIVVKTKINSNSSGQIPADVCFILEHKTKARKKIFIQVLKYMVEEWQKDIDEKKPLRIIIPVVFYHGKKDWNIPLSFVDQFDIDDELKKFLLNYSYFLFDTKSWDFKSETDPELKDNVFLVTAIALMKYAYIDDMNGIEEIFRFWHESGYIEEIDDVIFFLLYVTETKKVSRNQLTKLLEKSNLDGGRIMQTWVDKLREESAKIGEQRGIKKGEQNGIKVGRINTAREMLKDRVPIEVIMKYTSLTREEIKSLMQ